MRSAPQPKTTNSAANPRLSPLLTLVREGSPSSTLTLDWPPPSPPPVLGLREVYRTQYSHPAGLPAILSPPPVVLQASRLCWLDAS
jgi:hypothetical protein